LPLAWMMSKEMEMYLSFGSNLGDRKENIIKAASIIANKLNIKLLRMSGIIETEPWGFKCEEKFLNAVGVYQVGKDSYEYGLEVLSVIKDIEKEMGRANDLEYGSDGKRIYHSRPIDIDILLLGDLKCDGKLLTVPHPLMCERDFVMIPFKEVYIENN